MGGLFSLLLFAGFFFLMMRFGCGSHMTHGHHDKGHKVNNEPVIDPVCGRVVPENEGYGKIQSGILYRFCSKKCLDEFELQPDAFINRSDATKQLKDGGEHEA